MSCSLPDTDECLGTPCQQRCKNSIGSYRCSCRTGFHLHGNRHSCVGKGRDPVVFIFRLPIRKTDRVSPGTGKGQQSGPPWFPGACNRLSLCSEPALPWGWRGSWWKTLSWTFPGHMPLSSCYVPLPPSPRYTPRIPLCSPIFLAAFAPLGK